MTGQPRLRSNRDIRNLTGQPPVTSVIRSRRLQWVGQVVRALEDRGIWASDGETAPGQAKDAVGRQCSSGRHKPGVRDWQGLGGLGWGSRSVEVCGKASDSVVPTE